MRCPNRATLLVVALLLVLLPQQLAFAQEGVVYGVFFYSPSCSHCRQVIDHDWPSIQQEFGDQLRVVFIDASNARGNSIMNETRAALQIEAIGVPMLIIGEDALVGSLHIPARARDTIRAGIEAGGIALPPVASVQELYAAAVAEAQQAETDAAAQGGANGEIRVETVPELSLSERLAADPIANGLAVIILVLLIGSLVLAVAGLRHAATPTLARQTLHQALLIVIPMLGLGIVLSLLAGSDNQPLVIGIAVTELTIFGVLLLTGRQSSTEPPIRHWRVPLTALAGLGTAAYLASIEITQTEAVCGLVGNCNLVQQSPYAQIGGIPIGVIGIFGYLVILLLWTINHLSGGSKPIELALQSTALIGVVFSTYLTFLEPFVIGATCLWCLTSAVIMLLLFWWSSPSLAAVGDGLTSGMEKTVG